MVTAVDTNVFMDIREGRTQRAFDALFALKRALREGSVVCSHVCYAELAHQFPSRQELDEFLRGISCEVIPSSLESSYLAGRFHHNYLKRGGKRTRVIADFFIAADAQLNSDRLLTRDSRFFKDEFPDLVAVDPVSLLAP